MNVFSLCVIVVLGIFSTTAQAILLGSGQLPDNDIFIPANSTSSTARLYFAYSGYLNPTPVATFDEVVTASSAGTTFIYSSGIQFNNAVALLTNGEYDAIYGFASTYQSGGGHFESTLFSDDLPLLNGIDLGGYTITSIHWTIDAFSIGGANNDYAQISSSIAVHGSLVPIPPALWLFGSGILGLLGMARAKGKHPH